MDTYGNPEFEELLKDKENESCFDCNKSPAHWASVNNGIYLCLDCAGVHRGFGVGTSYIRSITMDLWNDNQVNMMKLGGNKNLRELLDVYSIIRTKTDKTILYNSRLLDFYRKHLKAKVNREKFDRCPPEKAEALKNLSADNYTASDSIRNISNNPQLAGKTLNEDKYKSISNTTPDLEGEEGFVTQLNNWMFKAINSTKFIANKFGELELGNKIITTGSVVAETGSTIIDKGTRVAESDKIKSFAKTTNDSINYVINKFFTWGKKKENSKEEKSATKDETESNENDNEVAKINYNNEVKFEKSNSKK